MLQKCRYIDQAKARLDLVLNTFEIPNGSVSARNWLGLKLLEKMMHLKLSVLIQGIKVNSSHSIQCLSKNYLKVEYTAYKCFKKICQG